MKVLEVENIFYEVENKSILNDISFFIEEGDACAIIGSNGSGKTSLLEILLNDIAPNKGTVKLFNDIQLNYDKVGILYDVMPVFPLLKVHEVVDYFALLNKIHLDKFEIEALLYNFKLEHVFNSFVTQLSLGEKQKIGLILSILRTPELLILDEPFSALDPIVIDYIWHILREKSKTILFTSHNWKEVERLANRIIMLRHGRLVAPPAEPDKLLSMLPSSKKIVFDLNTCVSIQLSNYDYYIDDNNVNVFIKNDTSLEEIKRLTYNYTVQNVDLKDCYLFLK